jgi:hypothetical protein
LSAGKYVKRQTNPETKFFTIVVSCWLPPGLTVADCSRVFLALKVFHNGCQLLIASGFVWRWKFFTMVSPWLFPG